ncbi:hypothetical protein ES708_31490 [subsurface metagenome]
MLLISCCFEIFNFKKKINMRIKQLLPVIAFLVISGQMTGQSIKLPDYKNPGISGVFKVY